MTSDVQIHTSDYMDVREFCLTVYVTILFCPVFVDSKNRIAFRMFTGFGSLSF
jgi:hypothetical protein